MLNNEVVDKIILDGNVKPSTYKLFIYLLGHIDKEYRVKGYTQQEIADNLNVSRVHIGSGFKQLRESNILIKESKDYFFNPKLFKE